MTPIDDLCGLHFGISRTDYDLIQTPEGEVPIANQSELKRFDECPWSWREGIPRKESDAFRWGKLFETLLMERGLFDAKYAVATDALRAELLLKHNEAKVGRDKTTFSKRLGTYQDWKKAGNSDDDLTDEVKAALLDAAIRKKAKTSFDVKLPEWIEWVKEQERCEREIADEWELTMVDKAVRKARTHPKIAEWMASGRTQVGMVWKDPDTGVYCKGLIDWLADWDNAITDIKTANRVDPWGFRNDARKFGYGIQGPFYIDGWHTCIELKGYEENECIHARPHWRFIVSQNKAPYAAETYQMDDQDVVDGRDRYKAMLERWKECHTSGLFPRHTEDGWVELPRIF